MLFLFFMVCLIIMNILQEHRLLVLAADNSNR
jgi:hypothetical protein